MATSTSSSNSPAAPWKSTFEEHVSKLSSPEFVLASLSPSKGGSVPYVPRLRYLVYRGMWTELPENKHNDAPKNDRVFETDMPTFTTDVRMQKVPQFFATGDKEHGGGGPVEAVWWIKDTMTQWRMKGEAFVVGGNEGQDGVKETLRRRMRVVGEERPWSWEKEVTAHFGNLNPGMRGSFKNPPPGTPSSQKPQKPEIEQGQQVHDLNDKVARENFRVVVIRPSEVEQIDLSDPGSSRRWRYTYVGPGKEVGDVQGERIGEWIKVELWP